MAKDGCHGARLTGETTDAAWEATERLSVLGDVTSKKMFGGYGVFIDAKMFALIDSTGGLYFKCDETNEDRYLEVGAEKHGRMPYREVPQEVWDDDDDLLDWAHLSADIARG
jgi:DNA transformation protein